MYLKLRSEWRYLYRAVEVEKTWAAQTSHETLVTSWSEGSIMEWPACRT